MRKGKSALFSLTAAVLAIVLVQIALIGGAIVASKVLPKLTDNAYEIFSQTVENRTGYIESEMYNRWSKIDVFIDAIDAAYPEKLELSNEEMLGFFGNIAPTLMTMLRDTGTTGSFIILNDNKTLDSAHSCLYFTDSDPGYNDLKNNSDLMILKGPIEFVNQFKIPLHIAWNYGITLSDENRDLFYQPYEAAQTVKNAEHLGYWSISPSFSDQDTKVITYTKPLISATGEVFGVAGVEISQDYLYKLLPETELSGEQYNAYAVVGDSEDGGLEPLIVQGAVLRNLLPYGQDMRLERENENFDGYVFGNPELSLSGHFEKIQLYNKNTPFDDKNWYILGVTNESSLTHYAKNLTGSLVLAITISLVISVLFSVLMGYFFSQPLQAVRRQISAFHPGEKLKLRKTGILEIDALSQAVEQLNEDVLNSVLKTDKIIDMVNLEIGSFEYKNGEDSVKVSSALANMLSLPCRENGFVNKQIFLDCMNEIRKNKTKENIYAFAVEPVKWLKVESVTTESGELGIVVDVTKDELARLALKRDRDFDTLTGIYNRFAFQRVLSELFEHPEFEHAAFVMCDLDNLKHINDTYGHDIGDAYIKATANFLMRYFKDKKAVYARMSGDEFYSFIYGYDSVEEIRKIVFGMHLALKSESIELPDHSRFRLKMSTGVAWYPEQSRISAELAHYADFAMYQGKQTIKGGVREFDPQLYFEQSYLFTGKEELYTILDEQLFDYVFQPIIWARDGQIYGYEALMRPNGKMVDSPDKLLHLAQVEGQLWKVEKNTFYVVLELAVLYRDLLKGCKLFLNSIPNQVLKETEYQELAYLYANDLPNLVIEITEGENINDTSLRRKKDLVKAWGAQLALDDYGSGYANDMLLLNLEPNIIKIDRFLVDGIEQDKNKQDIVKRTIAFAKERAVTVIAEGVETEIQLRTLISAGVDFIQGYYVSKPLPHPNFDCSAIVEMIRQIRGENQQ
ncbi:MAG: bifunctional diguanylate cyclase/phosphodiesterase [Evtepia sp.]